MKLFEEFLVEGSPDDPRLAELRHGGFNVGDWVRAWDFEGGDPRRPDRFVDGQVVEVWPDEFSYPTYKIKVTEDNNGERTVIFAPLEVGRDWETRIEAIEAPTEGNENAEDSIQEETESFNAEDVISEFEYPFTVKWKSIESGKKITTVNNLQDLYAVLVDIDDERGQILDMPEIVRQADEAGMLEY